MTYNPFPETRTNELESSHLAKLAEIPEGWFIEYKREPCKPKDYAKEASAFSNTHGGWIFVGLDEDPLTTLPAGGPGILTSEAQRLLDSARDAILQNLSPAPRLEFKVVNGPIAELQIAADRSVLVIRVPESQNSPHVHCSGRIYKRQVDTARPVELTNRSELDALYARSDRERQRISAVLDLGFDDGWPERFPTPWLHLACVPDPSSQGGVAPLPFARFKEVLSETDTGPGVALPDMYSSNLGHVARNHSQQIEPTGAATTLEYGYHGSVFATFPLSTSSLDSMDASGGAFSSPNGLRFLQLLRRKNFPESTQVVDGTTASMVLVALGCQSRRLWAAQGIVEPFFTRFRLFNMFRRVPFFDSDAFIDWCEGHGPPMMVRDTVLTPLHQNDWLVEKMPQESGFIQTVIQLLFALGLPQEILPKVASETVHATLTKK